MIETVLLAPNYGISRIIRGGWQQHAAERFDATAEMGRLGGFLDAGVLAFETADIYRHVDEALRMLLVERRRQGLALPRIHTRITLPRDVAAGCEAARERLGMDALDLVQLQSWALDENALREAALRLMDIVQDGKARHLGLMNVDAGTIERLWSVGVRPLTNQVQLSLLDRRALTDLTDYAQRRGIHILGYGGLAGGFVTDRWLDQPDPGMIPTPALDFHPEYRVVIEAFGGWVRYQALLGTLSAIAKRHAVSLACVALRWVLDCPGVAAILVGANNPSRVTEWQTVFGLRLTARDRAEIDEILAASEGPVGPVGGLERDPNGPFARAIAARRQ